MIFMLTPFRYSVSVMQVESTVPPLVEQGFGVLLMLVVLLDVFLTVLYARASTGIISRRLGYIVWGAFKMLASAFPRIRSSIFSFCGPAVLVSLLLTWALALALGAALIIHPKLGTSIRSTSGETPHDFATALFAGGSSISIVGASNFSPQTASFRLLYLLFSLVGMSVTSLTLTYLMQVYAALHRRNTLGLNIDLASGMTGDAAEVIAGLGPDGKFDAGYSTLSELAATMGEAKESHHFYPVLFYFRFHEPLYSTSRFTLVALDTVALMKSALADKEYGWLKESGAVLQLAKSADLLLQTLAETFFQQSATDVNKTPDAKNRELWRRRYFAAVRRLQDAGVVTINDEEAGATTYINLRADWNWYIAALGPVLAYSAEEIAPIGHRPELADEREPFRARLRSTGTR